MRRFFSRAKHDNNSSSSKDKDKDQRQTSTQEHSTASGNGNGRLDSSEQVSAAVAHPASTALRHATVADKQTDPVTPSKQVAFAVKALPATPDAFIQDDNDDVYSHVSYQGAPSTHGLQSGLRPCFPVASTSNSRSASNPTVPSQHLLPVPSLPVRHASFDVRDRDRDATLRASQTPTSPTRGEIPHFSEAARAVSLQSKQQQQQRSTTSLSQNTSVSTSSSMLDARQAFYGSNSNASHDNAYYPNLAILATYSRDMSSLNGHGGQNSIMQHLTWSEITDEQLVDNIGGRERTRQEVLFEMVCSEERYVQELIALKENYLQPLLERHSLSSAHTTALQGMLSSSTVRSIDGPAPILDVANYHSGTIKSTKSMDARRPFLGLSAGSTSTGLRYATPVSSDHGHGYTTTSRRAGHGRALESYPNASAENLPIAARFARRVSVDSPDIAQMDSGPVRHGNEVGSANTVRTAVEDIPEVIMHGRRDISGGSGTTAVDSREETDATSSSNRRQLQAGESGRKSNSKSRLHPLFATLSSSARHAEKENILKSNNQSTTSVNAPKTFRHHLKNLVPPASNKLHKISSPDLKDGTSVGLAGPGWVFKALPEDLRIVSEVVAENVLDGHRLLSERLRARYEEQFPLVRTLADVVNDQTWMVQHYATYVLHLERALADIEEALALMNPLLASNKKVKSKDKESVREQKLLAKIIMHLEEEAALKGAPGLSICLSQPFQRLLKYPLLFQSLLYHTDPSTRDYDATQKLAFEIDGIVRSIENEKASEEDRARTRDVWARIEGINDRALLLPRADRLLVSEAAMWSSTISGNSAVAAGRRTFSDAARKSEGLQGIAANKSKNKAIRRLSDMTGVGGKSDSSSPGAEKQKKQPSVGSKRDVWLVTFTDVVIRCQRVGVTTLPMQSSLGGTGTMSKKEHRKTVLLTTRERNLYKFQKIDHWVMEDKTASEKAGIVNMDAMARSRRTSAIVNNDEDRENCTDRMDSLEEGGTRLSNLDSKLPGAVYGNEAESRMSLAYSGDEPRPVVFDIDPLIGLKVEPSPEKSSSKVRSSDTSTSVSSSTQQALRKRGAAAAKFSNRLRPSTAGSSPLQGKRAITPTSGQQHPPRSASATYDRERGGFSKPTAASLAKASPPTSAFLTAGNKLPRTEAGRISTPEPKRVRAASSNASPRATRPSTAASPKGCSPQSPSKGTVRSRRNSLPSSKGPHGSERQLRTKHSSEHLGRQDDKKASGSVSGVALYNQFWEDN